MFVRKDTASFIESLSCSKYNAGRGTSCSVRIQFCISSCSYIILPMTFTECHEHIIIFVVCVCHSLRDIFFFLVALSFVIIGKLLIELSILCYYLYHLCGEREPPPLPTARSSSNRQWSMSGRWGVEGARVPREGGINNGIKSTIRSIAFRLSRRKELPERRRYREENFLRRADRDPRFPSRVIFSDESLFTREGIFNSHNMHLWSNENPRVTRLRNFQIRWKMNVWVGIMGTEILGPIILPEALTGVTYVEFLRDNLPDFLEDVPLLERNKIVFQQDGAGPHNARIVTNYLNEQFPERWMGRYGPIRWPARSPDLNPLDFFLWGYCKEMIYKTLPQDVEDLETKLRYAIWTIGEDLLQEVERNLLRRMRACVRMDGGHFEHLL